MKLQPESAIITIYISTVAMLVLISCDKSLHTYFECLLYHTLKNPLPEDVLHEIIRGAVDVERTFICEALSCDLIGMNLKMLQRYRHIRSMLRYKAGVKELAGLSRDETQGTPIRPPYARS